MSQGLRMMQQLWLALLLLLLLVEEVRPSLPRHSEAGATAPSPQEAVRGGRETSLFPYFLRRWLFGVMVSDSTYNLSENGCRNWNALFCFSFKKCNPRFSKIYTTPTNILSKGHLFCIALFIYACVNIKMMKEGMVLVSNIWGRLGDFWGHGTWKFAAISSGSLGARKLCFVYMCIPACAPSWFLPKDEHIYQDLKTEDAAGAAGVTPLAPTWSCSLPLQRLSPLG